MERLQEAEGQLQQFLADDGVVDLGCVAGVAIAQDVADLNGGSHLGLALEVQQIFLWLHIALTFETLFEFFIEPQGVAYVAQRLFSSP